MAKINKSRHESPYLVKENCHWLLEIPQLSRRIISIDIHYGVSNTLGIKTLLY